MTTADLEKQIDKLSEAEKKQLLRRLIADLDGGHDQDVEHAWLEEAQRRYQSLKDGTATPISTDEAIAKARDRLRHVR